jgi:hypothetical protein
MNMTGDISRKNVRLFLIYFFTAECRTTKWQFIISFLQDLLSRE